MATKKRILAFAVALVLCAAAATPALAAGGKKLEVHWFNETVGDDCGVVFANYVKEFGIFSLLVIDSEGYRVMNIDLVTGRQTDKYGDHFIYPFKEGRAMIATTGENVDIDAYGFMDTSGKVIREPVYDYATPFYEGYAAVKADVKKTGYNDGYIDTNGDPVYTNELWLALQFENGAALVQGNDGYAVLDTKFNYLVQPGKYSYIQPFNEGIAAVRDDNMKYGAVDSTGKEVIPCEYDLMSSCYDGLIAVAKRDGTGSLKYGYVDKSGKTVIPIQYDSAGDFCDGHALISEGDTVRIIDKTGNTVGTFSRKEYDYGYSTSISEDRIRVYSVVDNEPMVTMLDLTGKEVMPGIASTRMMEFNSGLALIYGDEGNIYVDRDGNRVIEPGDYDDVCFAYSSGDLLDDSYGTYVVVLKGGKLGYFVNPYADNAPQTDTTAQYVAGMSDVTTSDWFADAVSWALEKDIMEPASTVTFAPGSVPTRGDIIDAIWRAAGSPEPAGTEDPFTDVSGTDRYYKAVLWAADSGVTTGTTETTFEPGKTVSRGEIVTFLWRAANRPDPTNSENPFADAKADWYKTAVLWAVEKGITNGTNAAGAAVRTFSPDRICTKGELITFIYRQFVG